MRRSHLSKILARWIPLLQRFNQLRLDLRILVWIEAKYKEYSVYCSTWRAYSIFCFQTAISSSSPYSGRLSCITLRATLDVCEDQSLISGNSFFAFGGTETVMGSREFQGIDTEDLGARLEYLVVVLVFQVLLLNV